MRDPYVGQAVIYHDPQGRPHHALITTVWGKANAEWGPTCNVLWVSSDEAKQDGYGRQIERMSSCPHKNLNKVHGNYWRFEEETPNPVAEAKT